jgi:hypothetical protein
MTTPKKRARVRPSRSKPGSDVPRLDAEELLDDAEDQLRNHDGEAAVATIFRAAAVKGLPRGWTNAVKSIARQLRKVLEEDRKAEAAMNRGAIGRARLRIDKALAIVIQVSLTKTHVVIERPEFLEDYSAKLTAAATKMLDETRRAILNKYQQTMGMKGKLWPASVPSTRSRRKR